MSETGKPLPEKSRMARNIHEGWELKDQDSGEWLRVKMALHITSPIEITSFTFEDDTKCSAPPNSRVMSRYPGKD